ncbi:MAG: NADH-quinone oxidoreductase subunit G [Bacillota bacterium]|nr:MAG: NADH-quinone oxidoreductase subunit G [Bacillota bacterium]MBS3949524.1 [FeFe] hydrogenase, group A [Peptococcaceae bacterium]
MGDNIKLTVDGQGVEVTKGTTVLQAAKVAGIEIPTLCFLEKINEIGACRVCMVQVQGWRGLQASCVLPVQEGMVIRTNTPEIRQARRVNIELILSNHPNNCLTCGRNTTCELQKLASDLHVNADAYKGEKSEWPLDLSNPSLIRDPNKCILCRRCVAVCHQVQSVGALSPVERGFGSVISPDANRQLAEAACAYCGQCAAVCPTGALAEVDNTEIVFKAIGDKKHVVVQVAPAVRVAIGEEFGLARGAISTGQMVTGLRMLGFSAVFDTDFAADLTILEEAHELIERVKWGGKLPLITSCSPGWVKFVEHFYPEFLPNLSSCKSPQQMLGALIKSYYATDVVKLPLEQIYSVSVMPCTAKKYEASRAEMGHGNVQDVDAVLTTRELARMFRIAGIDLARLPAGEFDMPLGMSTGAGVIFGASGGVMEAALRTAFEWIAGVPLEKLDLVAVRGLEGVKEAQIAIPNLGLVKVAVANGLGNARSLLERIKDKEVEYHFVEIMACPGGCLGGGGQPRSRYEDNVSTKQARLESIYKIDRELPLRRSHENPAVKKLYAEYLGSIGGEKAHHLLHTTYVARGRFPWRNK